jgi:hypothetical protein
MEREKAMAVRNAYLALLRAWCDMHDLPQPIPTKAEQPNRDVTNKTGHHNR